MVYHDLPIVGISSLILLLCGVGNNFLFVRRIHHSILSLLVSRLRHHMFPSLSSSLECLVAIASWRALCRTVTNVEIAATLWAMCCEASSFKSQDLLDNIFCQSFHLFPNLEVREVCKDVILKSDHKLIPLVLRTRATNRSTVSFNPVL
jgi:hypothetical protein